MTRIERRAASICRRVEEATRARDAFVVELATGRDGQPPLSQRAIASLVGLSHSGVQLVLARSREAEAKARREARRAARVAAPAAEAPTAA